MDQSQALAVHLNRSEPTTLPVQLAGQIRDRIRRGELAAGVRLPSSRALADAVGVSRAVAGGAYDQLVAEGWLEARRGAGTYVRAVTAPQPTATPDGGPGTRPPGRRISLRPGEPWTPPQGTPAWRRAWREVAHAPPPAMYPDPRGLPELRAAIAEQMTRSRALPCRADQVLVTSGTTHGLGLLLDLERETGATIAMEDPGYAAATATATACGWQVRDVPVDESGFDPTALGPRAAQAAYVTPSHQYPLGVLMPIQRRLDILAWARSGGAYVIEDDYDSEFRYDVAPLPTLAELEPERVVYLGTVAKTLGAGIRLGWLIAPPPLIERLAAHRAARHDHPPWPLQRALLSLLRDGEWDRSVRAARRRYVKRDALVRRRLAPFGRLSGVGAGIHTTLLLEPPIATAVVAGAAHDGVEVARLSESARSRGDLDGLVIGYGAIEDEALDFAIGVLVDRLRASLRE